MSLLAYASLVLALAAVELPPISREEAAVCRRDRQAVDVRNDLLSAHSRQLGQEAAQIEQAERALEQLQAKVDADRAALNALKERMEKSTTLEQHLRSRKDFDMARDAFQADVARYNDGVRAQQARREPYNRDARQLNADIAVLDAEAKRVDARCAGRRVVP